MEENELMIRDWVQVPSELNRYKRISSTFDMDLAILYEPILITPEILEKIDLKIGNVTEYLGYDIYSDEEGTFGVSEDREGFVFETYKRWEEKDCDGAPIDWGFYPVNRIKGIRYFHELQHALRLCRIDKEIIL